MSEANSRIGVQDLTFAKMLSDTSGGATYDTPWAIGKKTVKIGVKGSPSSEKQYADDQTVNVYVDDGDITFTIDLTDLTEDEKALLLGQTVSAGIRTPNPTTDVKPYWAVSFKALKRNKKYKYYKFLKVIFEEPDEDFETKKDKIAPQEDKLMGMGIQRLYDGLRKRIADEDSTSYVAGTGSGWFTSGDVSPDTTPPTYTITPIDGATAQATSVNIVWTFNEAIQSSLANLGNFIVTKADGTAVAGALTIDSTNKIVTFDPTSALTAGTTYISTVSKNVKDLSGNGLADNGVNNFATA